MAQRFGEQISDSDAYNTARAATADMTKDQLARAAADENLGANQRQAAQDALASK